MSLQGNILYGAPPAAGGGAGPVFEGARNGTSLDAGGFVVLGEFVGAPGNPSKLLNNRQVIMNGFMINWNSVGLGGINVFSDDQVNVAAPNTVVEIDRTEQGVAGGNALRINTNDTTNGPGTGIPGLGIYNNGFFVAAIESNGQMALGDGKGSIDRASLSPTITVPINANGFASWGEDGDFQCPSGTGQWSAFLSATTFEDDNSAGPNSIEIAAFRVQASYNRTTTGNTYGYLFEPTVLSIGTGKLVAIENRSGDVYLNSTAGSRQGRTGVRVTTPTANLHLGAGSINVGGSALKINTGAVLTTPEQGSFEYVTPQLFFTPAAARMNVLLGVDGAAAPASNALALPGTVFGTTAALLGTPASWAAVTVNGTAYKVPLYI